MTTYTRQQIIQIITDEATKLGVPVQLALATAQQESGLNAASIGDGGHSVGLFQLNDQGEGHGMTAAQREDPVVNARIALTQIANVMKSQPNLTGGALAAAAQRPADPAGYAQAVNSGLGRWSVGYQGSTLMATENDNVPAGSGGSIGSTPVDLRQFAAQNGIPPQWVNDPEFGPLLDQFENNQISFEQFQAQASQTQIWKTTPQSQRIAEAQAATDPATLGQTIQQGALSIHNTATRLGITLTPAQELDLSAQANAGNWTPEQLQQNLAKRLTSTSQATSGEAATDINSLRQMYKNYQVPVTDGQLNTQLQQMLSGAQTITGLQSSVAQQAKLLYSNNPQLSKNISDTVSTMDALNPLISQAANQLGVTTDSIDPSNAKWSFLTKPTTDPTTGQSTGNMLTLDDVNKKIQQDPVFGYSTTSNGIAAYTNMADALRNAFSGGAAVK